MKLQIGDTAPPFVAPDLKNGASIALDNYLDKPVVVVFSGLSWCAPCQFEAPILQELRELYSWSVQFVIVSVGDQDKATLQAAVQQFGLIMPVIQDDLSIAKDWIFDGTPQTGISWSVPQLFVLQPSPSLPSRADHDVVCDKKVGAPPPEAALKVDLNSRIQGYFSSSGSGSDYWKEYNPIPWIGPGPLQRLTPRKRDILIDLGLRELSRNLSNPSTGRQLEQLAADAMSEAAQRARKATHAKTIPPSDMEAIETRPVKG